MRVMSGTRPTSDVEPPVTAVVVNRPLNEWISELTGWVSVSLNTSIDQFRDFFSATHLVNEVRNTEETKH